MKSVTSQAAGPIVIVVAIVGALMYSSFAKRNQEKAPDVDTQFVPVEAEPVITGVTLVNQGSGKLPTDAFAALSAPAKLDVKDGVPFWGLMTVSLKGRPGPQPIPGRCVVAIRANGHEYPCYRSGTPDWSSIHLLPGLTEVPGPYELYFYDPKQGITKTWPVPSLRFSKRLIPRASASSASFGGVEFSIAWQGNSPGLLCAGQVGAQRRLSVEFLATSYEPLHIGPILLPPRTEGKNAEEFFRAQYSDQLDSVRLRVEELEELPVHKQLRFPGAIIKEQFGQPYLELPPGLSGKVSDGLIFGLSTPDPPPNRVGRPKDYVRLSVTPRGYIVSGKARMTQPTSEKTGIGFLLESRVGTTGGAFLLERGSVPARGSSKPVLGPVGDIVLDVDVVTLRPVRSAILDLVVPKPPPEPSKR